MSERKYKEFTSLRCLKSPKTWHRCQGCRTFTKNVLNWQASSKLLSRVKTWLVLRACFHQEAQGKAGVQLTFTGCKDQAQTDISYSQMSPHLLRWLFGWETSPQSALVDMVWDSRCQASAGGDLASGYYQLCYSESEWLAVLQPSNPPSNSRLLPLFDNPDWFIWVAQREGSNALYQLLAKVENEQAVLSFRGSSQGLKHPWATGSIQKENVQIWPCKLPFLANPLKTGRWLWTVHFSSVCWCTS